MGAHGIGAVRGGGDGVWVGSRGGTCAAEGVRVALGVRVRCRGGGTEPGAGEAGEEGVVGGFFCRVGCGGVELQGGRVGGVWLGREGVEGRVGEGGGGDRIVTALCGRVLWGV